jgi:lipopolysaccharide biosynthesis glycosyltransferase
MEKNCSIWIGFEPRDAVSFAICRASIEKQFARSGREVPVHGIVLSDLRRRGLYVRETEVRDGELYDVISEHTMSTEFAISRFFTPLLAKTGWALFMDSDMLIRGSLTRVFDLCDDKYAVMCVKHDHVPDPREIVKMDGKTQSRYARKNWSSFVLYNCDHPSNRKLTLHKLNSLPGRDLHRFCWLEDEEIGEIGPEWNYLVGVTETEVNPQVVHFTKGGPWLPRYSMCDYADEWFEALEQWAA